MEHIAGRSLDEIPEPTTGQGLSRGEVVRVGLQLLSAVEYLAEQGILHLDIKPSNIMLNPRGEVVLVDLGTASQALDATHDSEAFFGTPKWAAPERPAGHPGDERSETYSVALVMCELLGLRAPAQMTRRRSCQTMRPCRAAWSSSFAARCNAIPQIASHPPPRCATRSGSLRSTSRVASADRLAVSGPGLGHRHLERPPKSATGYVAINAGCTILSCSTHHGATKTRARWERSL